MAPLVLLVLWVRRVVRPAACVAAAACPTLFSMSKSRREVLAESKRKGIVAGATAAATVTLGVVVSLPVAAVAAVPAAWLGYRWWKHRSENGIKF